MKAMVGFIFFMLFLAGLAFVTLRGVQDNPGAMVTSAEQLMDVAWRPTNVGDTVIDETSPMRLQFNDKGQMAGHAGCNRYFGSYEFRDGGLVFSMVGSTRMACDEPANTTETNYLQMLNQVAGAARADNRLAIRDAEGRTLARYVAVPRD